MKKVLLFIIIYFFTINQSLALDHIYKSKFYSINIENDDISAAKLKEIDKIKILTLNDIFLRILTLNEYNNLNKLVNLYEEVDKLIQNIIIENEFISNKKYSANIKINFNKTNIINLLRNKRVNYTDFESEKLLIIALDKNSFYSEGLSIRNVFYINTDINKFGLLNFEYPDLSLNDRYILPYEKINNNDFIALNKIAKKYSIDKILIIKFLKINNATNYEINFYFPSKNYISETFTFVNQNNYLDIDNLFSQINNFWKQIFFINNSIINKKSCYFKNSNIHELYYLKSKLYSISQIKSLNLKKISLGLNLYDVIFYGDLINLLFKLNKLNISLEIKGNNKCFIIVNS